MTCPLCRTNWGPDAIEQLRENTKQWKQNKISTNKANAQSVNAIVAGATNSASAAAAAA